MRRASMRMVGLVLAALVAGCGGDRLSGLVPLLAAKAGSVADPTHEADYVVDFGEVLVDSTSEQTFYVTNKGRAALTVQLPEVASPFAQRNLTRAVVVQPQGELGVEFTYAPTEEGAAQTVVTLDSDGGELTVRLTGRARAPQPTDCAFDVSPTSLDFGALALGQSKTLSFRLSNTGANPCDVSRLSLTASTSDAFSIAGGAVASETIGAGQSSDVSVVFAPTHLVASYAGAVQFGIGPPMAAEAVSLRGSVPPPCPGALPDGSCPAAPDPVYVNDPSTLYSWDASTLRATRIGSFSESGFPLLAEMTDIAIDDHGVMMGVASDDTLYVIDPSNATCRRVGTLAEYANGLTFLPDGTLIASGDGVWKIDKNTGALVSTLPSGGYSTSGDLVALPDGKLYWAVTTSGADALVRLDPNTGATQVVTSFGITDVYGVAYESGLLYGFGNGEVVTIDPAAGRVVATHSLVGSWYGATTNPATWNQ